MRRIFIISNHLMFRYGLESLLGQDDELDIVGQAEDVKQAIAEIDKLQPDVVILDSDRPSYPSIVKIMQTVKKNSRLKVIGLNLNNNTLCLHQATRQIVEDVGDLVGAIKQGVKLMGYQATEDRPSTMQAVSPKANGH